VEIIELQMLKFISLCLEMSTQCSIFMNVAASMAEGTAVILFVMFQITNARFVFKHPTLHRISQEEVQQN
jgi:homogentisate 1,2-dioxygenase